MVNLVGAFLCAQRMDICIVPVEDLQFKDDSLEFQSRKRENEQKKIILPFFLSKSSLRITQLPPKASKFIGGHWI